MALVYVIDVMSLAHVSRATIDKYNICRLPGEYVTYTWDWESADVIFVDYGSVYMRQFLWTK